MKLNISVNHRKDETRRRNDEKHESDLWRLRMVMDFLLLFSTTASLSHVAVVDTIIIPCQPTHSHCTQFRQLLLFFFLLSKSIFFAGPAHRKGFFANSTSVTGCSGKLKFIAHSNATCIKRPAGLMEKFLSLLITTRFFWPEFSHFRPNFWNFPEHRPEEQVKVAISSSRSALHPHLFTHNSDEKFLLCTWKKAEKKRIDCSVPARCGLRLMFNDYQYFTRFLSLFRYQKEEKRKIHRLISISLNSEASRQQKEKLEWRTPFWLLVRTRNFQSSLLVWVEESESGKESKVWKERRRANLADFWFWFSCAEIFH